MLWLEPTTIGSSRTPRLYRSRKVDWPIAVNANAIATAERSGKAVLESGDRSAAGEAERIVAKRPDVIFHLAAIVSGEAELDFDKGYRINLDGTRHLFDAIRVGHGQDGYKPRVDFTSSIAVSGAPLPYPIPDEFHTTPLTSYGTQKAIGELLLSD